MSAATGMDSATFSFPYCIVSFNMAGYRVYAGLQANWLGWLSFVERHAGRLLFARPGELQAFGSV